ncbi:MAG: DUF1631 family protein [Burkholderiaceae bacterium]
MQNASDIAATSSVASHAATGPSPVAGGSLPLRVRRVTIARVVEIIEQASAKVGEDLNELAGRTFQADRQRALFAGASLLNDGAREIVRAFEQAYADRYDNCLGGRAGKAVDAAVSETESGELSLVDDGAITDSVQISRLVHRTRGRIDSDELLGARARFGAMLNRDWFDDAQHPLAPEQIFDVLNAQLASFSSTNDTRLILLEGYEPYLSANLPAVYGEINALLRDNGVLPKIKRRVAVSGPSGRRAAAPGDDPHATEAQTDAEAETFHLPPPGPDREAVLSILARRLSEGTVEARRSAVRMLREATVTEDLDDTTLRVDDDLIDRLSRLQSDAGESVQGSMPSQRLRSLTGTDTEAGSALDRMTVEIVSLIFDFLYHDPRIPEAVKHQLLRLQVVAVKAALLDRSFFASKAHPMRQFIDRATEISCDPDTDAGSESAFVAGLGGIVDDILAQFDRDLDVFTQAAERLEALGEREQERRDEQLRDFTEQAERAESERLAHDEGRRELAALINDLTPGFVREFLLERWSRVLAAARLQGPPGEPGRDAAMAQASSLIWSIEPKRAADIPRMAALLPSLVRELMTGLDKIGESRDAVDGFFNELMSWHTRAINQAKIEKRAPAEKTDAAFEGARPMREVPPPRSMPADDGDELLDGLQRGQLIEVRQKNKAPIRVKLAWVSPARTLFALSRQPDFARSLTRVQMSASLRSGRLVVVEREGAVERAMRKFESTGEAFPDTAFGSDTLVMETGIHVPV